MRMAAPTLAPMFRSAVQLRILGELYCGSKDSYTLSELAVVAGTSAPTVGREIERLRSTGVVDVTPGPGRSKLASANWELPWAPDLRRILAHTGGLVPALGNLLSRDYRIEAAYVFGSWARRFHGEAGHFPHDIDLVVVTDTSPFELDIAWTDVAGDLGIKLNPIYRPTGFDPAIDALVSNSPTVELDLTSHDT